jgi:hypothetical protein
MMDNVGAWEGGVASAGGREGKQWKISISISISNKGSTACMYLSIYVCSASTVRSGVGILDATPVYGLLASSYVRYYIRYGTYNNSHKHSLALRHPFTMVSGRVLSNKALVIHNCVSNSAIKACRQAMPFLPRCSAVPKSGSESRLTIGRSNTQDLPK